MKLFVYEKVNPLMEVAFRWCFYLSGILYNHDCYCHSAVYTWTGIYRHTAHRVTYKVDPSRCTCIEDRGFSILCFKSGLQP